MSTQEELGQVTVPTFQQPSVVPILKINTHDFYTVLLPGGIGLLCWLFLDMGYLGLSLPIVSVGLGSLYVVAAPSYLTAVQWTKTLLHYAKSPTHYDSIEDAAVDADHSAFDTTESTQDLTGVARFYPRDHVLELEDGSLVAFS